MCENSREKGSGTVHQKQWFSIAVFGRAHVQHQKMVQYTGRFKVRRMVQSRILRKNNPDAHYTNAIQRFIIKRGSRISRRVIRQR